MMLVAYAQAPKGSCLESQSFFFPLGVDLQIVLTPEEGGTKDKGCSFDERGEEGRSEPELYPPLRKPCPGR